MLCCAESLQPCLILCDPMDCSPPGSSVHGILQARVPEWVETSRVQIPNSLLTNLNAGCDPMVLGMLLFLAYLSFPISDRRVITCPVRVMSMRRDNTKKGLIIEPDYTVSTQTGVIFIISKSY